MRSKFSQKKYLMKKKQRYLTLIMVLKITPENLCDAIFESKDAAKICYLRTDTLGYMLHQAAFRPGSRILVFDGTKGFMTGAIMHRV